MILKLCIVIVVVLKFIEVIDILSFSLSNFIDIDWKVIM